MDVVNNLIKGFYNLFCSCGIITTLPWFQLHVQYMYIYFIDTTHSGLAGFIFTCCFQSCRDWCEVILVAYTVHISLAVWVINTVTFCRAITALLIRQSSSTDPSPSSSETIHFFFYTFYTLNISSTIYVHRHKVYDTHEKYLPAQIYQFSLYAVSWSKK